MADNEINDRLCDVVPEFAGEEATLSTDEYGIRDAVVIVEFYDDASESTYTVKASVTVVNNWDDWSLDSFKVLSIHAD